MKLYIVTITPEAEQDLERFFAYLERKLLNPQAADAFLEDYEDTVRTLIQTAGSIRIGEHPTLKSRNLRRINFRHHNYFLLFHINGDNAVVDAIGHTLQDIDNVIH